MIAGKRLLSHRCRNYSQLEKLPFAACYAKDRVIAVISVLAPVRPRCSLLRTHPVIIVSIARTGTASHLIAADNVVIDCV